MTEDLEIEAIINQLLTAESAIRNHYLLYQSTMEDHHGIIDRMWILAQRYSIIIRGVSSKCTSFACSTHQIEDEIRTEFCVKLNLIGDLNSKLMSSLTNLQNTRSLIDRSTAALHICSLDKSDANQTPIAYLMEILSDYLKFFIRTQSKLNCLAILLTPDNVSSLERYRKLLQPNKEFDYHFSVSTALCNCLRAHKIKTATT